METPSPEDVEFVAKSYGWVRIPSDSIDLSFTRKGTRINIWYARNGTFTVGTALDHPVQGKTQLFRRNVTPRLLETILDYPRVHTNRGYQRKG